MLFRSIVLNLFIAVAVEALDRENDDDKLEIVEEVEESERSVLEAIEDLRAEVASLRTQLGQDDATASK